MAAAKCSGFSTDAKYFALCGADGKLRIWETATNLLKQEFTPKFHLTTPCTCLIWISTYRNPQDTGEPCRRKKRKSASTSETNVIAMGTTNGKILLYSFATASVEAQLEGGHGSSAVNDLSWFPGTSLYSCGNDTIAEWNVYEAQLKSKWKTGTQQVNSVLVSPDSKWVLSASQSIKWWDAESHALITTFSGHASPVISLTFIPQPASSGDFYFLSAAKGDRYINAWILKKKSDEKSAVVSLVLENEPTGSISIQCGTDGSHINIAAVTISGSLHVFEHQLNGRCVRPLKPSHSVQIATDAARGKESVDSLPIVNATHGSNKQIQLVYGEGSILAFERILPDSSEKLQVLLRQDPRRQRSGAHIEESTSKVRVPDSSADVEYVLPASVGAIKRTHNRQAEVPMENRIENLSISVRSDEKGVPVPRADNLAHLLLQALQSKDRTMLNTVLLRREEDVLKSTVRRLPLQMIESLLKELTTLIYAKTATAQAAARWLRVVLTTHASHLMANPSLAELLAPVLGLVESRLTILPTLSRLSGRLDLLSAQLDAVSAADENADTLDSRPGLLVYQDDDSSDEDNSHEGALGSESDDHWDELSNSDTDQDDVDDDEEVNDVDMSD